MFRAMAVASTRQGERGSSTVTRTSIRTHLSVGPRRNENAPKNGAPFHGKISYFEISEHFNGYLRLRRLDPVGQLQNPKRSKDSGLTKSAFPGTYR
jgi:hypothetical protein